ncbi:MAG: S8 family serine peptidase [Minicystis sp.]
MAPRSTRLPALLRALLATSALTLLGAAPPPAALAVNEAPSFLDGHRRVGIERLGAPTLDDRGQPLFPVRLRYPGREAIDALIDDTVLVDLEPGAERSIAAIGVTLLRPLMPSIGLWLARDNDGADAITLSARLERDEARRHGVRRVMPNLYLTHRAHGDPITPNDPRYGGQWYFDNLRMPEAWSLTLGDPSSSIVIVDTGCDLTHPDLVAKMDPGRDVVDGDDDPSPGLDEMGSAHGTSCAGLAGAATNNEVGIAGACPACRLRCVRLLNGKALPLSADVEAFQFALDKGAAVVSNSWGFTQHVAVPVMLADAINNVFDHGRGGKGALVLFAAGNDDRVLKDDELEAVRGVLCIGAINNFDEQAPFTNSGNALDLVAPTGTLTTDISGAAGDDPTDYTNHFGGTSSSCPVAAGIAGLLVSAAPDLTSAELYAVLIKTARPAPFAQPDAKGHDQVYGYGIIDPVKALKDVLHIEDPPDGGGTGGAGTTSGTGGAGTTSGTGGQGTGGSTPPADAGCGCSLPENRPDSRAILLYAGAVALVRLRRRTRR